MARVALGVHDDELLAEPDPGQPRALPVKEIQPNPENPRPPDSDVRETAASLRDHGQLHNINVMTTAAFVAQKPHLADQLNDAPYVVINGYRRWLAAPEAGLETLKHEVHDDWTENNIDEAVVAENDHRVDVNPLLLGRHLARMLPRYGSHRKLAHALNKPQAWVSQRIGLTTLHVELQAAILADRLPFKLTRECTRLHSELQPLLASGELPVEVAQAWVVDLRLKPDEQLARWAAGPPYLTEETTETVVNNADEPVSPVDEEMAASSRTPRQRPAVLIRLSERSPTLLADALRKQLTSDEITELVDALSS